MSRFKSASHATLIQKVFSLLPRKTFHKLVLLIGFQIIATFLDILALILLGFLTKTGVELIKGTMATISIPHFNFRFFESMKVEHQFAFLFGIVVILFVARTLLALWGNRKILLFLGARSAQASGEILRRLFESKPQYIISKQTQELLYGVTSGVDNLVLSYFGSFVILVSELFFLIAVIGSLLIVQPVAGLCALLIFGGMGYWIHKFTSKSSREDSAKSSEISVKYSQQLIESLHIYREHFLRGSITDATSEVQKLRSQFLEIRAKLMFLPTLSKYLFEFVLILGSFAVAVLQFLITDASGAISSAVLFLGASSRILPSVVRVQAAFLTLRLSEGASEITLRQLNEFELNSDKSLVENSNEGKRSDVRDYILFEDVFFKYPEENSFSLRDLNFSIARGQLVAIVGESGAGKSTLADLLLGVQEPNKGTITISGVSPRSYVKKNPGVVGYVPQDIALLNGTVLENVTLTKKPHLDNTQVISSLNKASLLQETQLSRLHVDTFVGERGMKLSGGQRQRLGIARALYTNPELIVFDEATSSLDPRTEKVVTEAIYRNHGQVTLIVIAHRLSTVKKADLVLLLDQGSLVASGTFEEVRAKAPKFDEQAKLANL